MRWPVSVVCLLMGVCAASSAAAQLGAETGTGNNLNIEHYQPVNLGLTGIRRTQSERWREFSVGLFLHYSRNPLVLFADRLQIGEVVSHRVSQDLVGTLGILPWLEAGMAFPLTWYQGGDSGLPTGDIANVGLRDLRLFLKFTAVRQADTGLFGLAFVPEISLPIGDDGAFLGDGNLVFSPQLIIDRRFDVLWGITPALAGGVRIRPRSEIGNIEIDDELFYRLGLGVGLPNVANLGPMVIGELSGASRLDDLLVNKEQNPLDASLAMKLHFEVDYGHQIIATLGGAIGLTRGYGSPDFQIFGGVVYRRYLSDRDGDGIFDEDDACPNDPEDKDGFQDLDGCPEPDNDRDGIPDVADKCPDDPEDKDGFQDLDGCPEPDNDRDGIPDGDDKCPNIPEDLDGFEDEDGCPEEDNDRDGIPDEEDKCPESKETINGIDDEDGCPDEGKPHVEVTSEKVTIDTKIMFDFDSARIRPESYSILNQVALTLKANPQLTRVRVEGHTDERGSDEYNLDLSQRRAESVMRYLIGRKVEAGRLNAVGYGELQPIIEESNERAWAKNRRVEFTILDDPTPAQQGTQLQIPETTTSTAP